MRFFLVLVTLSMFMWAASAVVAHPKAKAAETTVSDDKTGVSAASVPETAAAAGPDAPDVLTATDVTTTADPAAAAAPAAAAGGPPPTAPSGPPTAAEEKADSVVNCMMACGSAVACQNACITTGYNVPAAPPAGVTAVVSGSALPTASLPVPTGTIAGANPSATPSNGAQTHSSAVSVSVSQGLQVAGALVVLVLSGALVQL